MRQKIALLALTQDAAILGQKIQRLTLPNATLYGKRGRVAQGQADQVFDDVGATLRRLFIADTAIIGICAAGVLIRCLAVLLADKRLEPPVLALSETGSVVVPLLGGHGRAGQSGANALARQIATALNKITVAKTSSPCLAAITTAGDTVFGLALDDPPTGWRLADEKETETKTIMAHLLSGGGVQTRKAPAWIKQAALREDSNGPEILESIQSAPSDAQPTSRPGLIYHPARLVIGIGCVRNADVAELEGLVRSTFTETGLALPSVALIVSLDVKMDEPAIMALANILGVPIRFFDAARLEIETTRLATPSKIVFAAVGCHGVAEAACLAAAGVNGKLLVHKRKTKQATLAIAEIGPDAAPLIPEQIQKIGRKSGHLALVSIGPGGPDWRTPESEAMLDQASDWVGYRLYLDLLTALPGAAMDKVLHPFELGAEKQRVQHALNLAAEGRNVALISSGDAGIYAMASLVFEMLDQADSQEYRTVKGSEIGMSWRKLGITVAPGITAMQAAAARLGAPLGHDFCAISLSDLLTPWSVIVRRIEAAAQGDFVTAFYNPISQRRTTQLGAACMILRHYRPPTTPVAIARNLGRENETIKIVNLETLDPSQVDMLSLVLVGSSQTRIMHRGNGTINLYTPRGYL